MPTSRFLQEDEDSTRLPEGFTRIAYDADTRVYTYKDRHGRLYQGAPGNEYGRLNPVPKESSLEKTRPGAFASTKERSKSLDSTPRPPGSTPSTFQDFLPPALLTSSTLSEKSPTGLGGLTSPSPSPSSPAKVQFRDAVKKASMMQGVVHGLRRSITTFRKNAQAGSAGGRVGGGYGSRGMGDGADSEDTRPLVGPSGSSSSSLYRSSTTSTTSSTRSDRTLVAVRQNTC